MAKCLQCHKRCQWFLACLRCGKRPVCLRCSCSCWGAVKKAIEDGTINAPRSIKEYEDDAF